MRGRLILACAARARVVAIFLIVLAAALAVPRPPAMAAGLPELRTLHGFMLQPVSEKRPDGSQDFLKVEVWSKGNRTRIEIPLEKGRLVTIQDGGEMWSFVEGEKTGAHSSLGRGLGSHGLVEQVELVKARGERGKVYEQDGERYVAFSWRENMPNESADVLLNERNSLPLMWISVVRTGGTEAEMLKVHYREMEANVPVSDDLFRVPEGIAFEDE